MSARTQEATSQQRQINNVCPSGCQPAISHCWQEVDFARGFEDPVKAPGKVNLLPAVRDAVQLNQTSERQMLATLHVLRLIRENHADRLPPLGTGTNHSLWQTMMSNCYAAVSHATGDNHQDVSAVKYPELAQTYELYKQSLPAGHVKPTRPTWLKHVSIS